MKFKRILATLLMLAMLMSSTLVLADEMVELTPEQIAELTGVEECSAEKTEPTVSSEATPKPFAKPTAEAEVTVEPITEPAIEATIVPTVEATAEPTVEPNEEPTVEPMVVPTEETIAEATIEPTKAPVEEPTAEPETNPINEIEEIFDTNSSEPDIEISTSIQVPAQESADNELSLAINENDEDFVVINGVLVEYRGKTRDIVIPSNLGIHTIGSGAFESGPSLYSVIIPEGVIKIDEESFRA